MVIPISKINYASLLHVVAFMVLMAFGLLLAFPLKWTWNYVMPYLFDLPIITWGHAWCLNFICLMLFKSIKPNNSKE